MKTFKSFKANLEEKKLTPAEMKKREEVAKAIHRENPNMPMGMKMAIATKTAKRVAEDVENIDEMMSPAETYKKIAVKHLRDSMDKNATQKQRDYAKMMNKRALEAAKMSNHTDALNHYRGVKEENELDELNQMTLQRYASKAQKVGMTGGPKSAKHLAGAQRAKEKLKYGDYSEEVKDEYARKVDKYLKKKYNKEEIEQVDEVSKKTAVSYIQKKVSQIAKRPGDAMLYTTKMTDKDYSNLKRAYKRAGVKEEIELEEATQFKSKEDAVKYAKEKVKTHRDPEDGIEIYSHGEGYRVSHTSNTAGRNSLKKMGAKHVGTIFKEEVELDEAGPFSYGVKSPKKGSVAYNAMMKRKEQDNKPPIEPKDQMVGTAKLRKEEVEDQHYCAKHVYSNVYGEGVVLEGQHADPDEHGDIEWYVVEFASGPKKVYTEKLDIMVAEYHGNHKKKRMTNG